MQFLLDTHLLLWIPSDAKALSRKARKLLTSSENEFLFSAASLWEIAIKRGKGFADFPYDPRSIRRQMIANGYRELAIDGEHVLLVETLPLLHKDPFDRLLIAQATAEGITLLTADEQIAQYPGPIQKV